MNAAAAAAAATTTTTASAVLHGVRMFEHRQRRRCRYFDVVDTTSLPALAQIYLPCRWLKGPFTRTLRVPALCIAMRCCARDSSSVYFSGGIRKYVYATLRAFALRKFLPAQRSNAQSAQRMRERPLTLYIA